MKIRVRSSLNAPLAIFVSCLLILPSYAMTKELKVGDRLPPPFPLIMKTDAIESQKITLDLNMSGAVQAVHAQTCNECGSKKFLTDSGTVFHIGAKKIARKALHRFNGKSGTVVFNKKTNVLTQVNFFDLED